MYALDPLECHVSYFFPHICCTVPGMKYELVAQLNST